MGGPIKRYALAVATLLACDAPAQPPSSVPRARAAESPAVAASRATSLPATALLAVRLTQRGEVVVGDVRPKPVAWRGPLSVYEPPPGLARTRAENIRPGAERTVEIPTSESAPHYQLVVVARAPGRPAMSWPLLLDAPGGGRGDVIDPWTASGAVWRVPWYGAATRYEVVRVAPRPAVLATWPAR